MKTTNKTKYGLINNSYAGKKPTNKQGRQEVNKK